jgi:hypothetical protein
MIGLEMVTRIARRTITMSSNITEAIILMTRPIVYPGALTGIGLSTKLQSCFRTDGQYVTVFSPLWDFLKIAVLYLWGGLLCNRTLVRVLQNPQPYYCHLRLPKPGEPGSCNLHLSGSGCPSLGHLETTLRRNF